MRYRPLGGIPARRGMHAAFLDEAPVEQVTDGAVGAALLHVEEAGQAALALEVVAPGVAEAEDARVDEQGRPERPRSAIMKCRTAVNSRGEGPSRPLGPAVAIGASPF